MTRIEWSPEEIAQLEATGVILCSDCGLYREAHGGSIGSWCTLRWTARELNYRIERNIDSVRLAPLRWALGGYWRAVRWWIGR